MSIVVIFNSDNASGWKDEGSLPYMRRELSRLIDGLTWRHKFQLIVTRGGGHRQLPTPEGERDLQPARRDYKLAAHRWLKIIQPARRRGECDPRGAIDDAYDMDGGPPDVVYFIIDGPIDKLTIDTVERVNKNIAQVPIHVIALRKNSSERLLQKIAEMTGGSYKHIPEAVLQRRY
jgi:hypothetical protein